MNAADYRRQLELLLPTGPALEPTSQSRLEQFLDGMARELARIEARGVDLLNEADPKTSTELFSEWLIMAGIPDACSVAFADPTDERDQLVQKLTARGGQTIQFFIELAAAYGYTSRVEEFPEFVAEKGSAGDRLTDGPWINSFSLIVSDPSSIPRAGVSRAGDTLGSFSSDLLNCVLQQTRGAHLQAFLGFE